MPCRGTPQADAATPYGQNRLPGFSGKWEVRSLFEIAERKKELFDDGDWVKPSSSRQRGSTGPDRKHRGGYFAEKEAKKYISAESYKNFDAKNLGWEMF